MALVITDTEIFEKLAAKKEQSNLYDLSNQDTIKIIEDSEQLINFVHEKLRKEHRTLETLEEKRVLPQLKKMQAIKRTLEPTSQVVIRGGLIMVDEPDNHGKNDGWGSWHVFSFLVLKSKQFDTELLMNPVSVFMH